LPVSRSTRTFFPSPQIADGPDAAHSEVLSIATSVREWHFVTRRGHAKILDFRLAGTAARPIRASQIESLDDTFDERGGHGIQPDESRLHAQHRRLHLPSGCAPKNSMHADLFSFGAVLYEMATGTAVSRRKQRVILSAILNDSTVPALRIPICQWN
jgi:hypothetical protein